MSYICFVYMMQYQCFFLKDIFEALEFYAAKHNWQSQSFPTITGDPWQYEGKVPFTFEYDQGAVARKALRR